MQVAMRILIDKSERKLRLYENGKLLKTYPVATGRSTAITPEGSFSIVFKTTCPGWTNPDTDKFVPGCTSRNPLGTRWLGLGVGNTRGRTYGIHGTNTPSSVGRPVTHGCVRMYNWDVQELYERVPLGTMVTIQK
jgi:lipoprotein-anchoring transpeptidase ErfK/SrfK